MTLNTINGATPPIGVGLRSLLFLISGRAKASFAVHIYYILQRCVDTYILSSMPTSTSWHIIPQQNGHRIYSSERISAIYHDLVVNSLCIFPSTVPDPGLMFWNHFLKRREPTKKVLPKRWEPPMNTLSLTKLRLMGEPPLLSYLCIYNAKINTHIDWSANNNSITWYDSDDLQKLHKLTVSCAWRRPWRSYSTSSNFNSVWWNMQKRRSERDKVGMANIRSQ